MALDPRTPVIIGVGQILQHADGLDDALDPTPLMAQADRRRRRRCRAATIPDAAIDPRRQPADVAVRRPRRSSIAQQLGLTPARDRLHADGRQQPAEPGQRDGRSRSSAGDSTSRSSPAARRGARACGPARPASTCTGRRRPSDQPPRIIGDDLVMNHPAELERGVDDAGADLPDVRDRRPRRSRARRPTSTSRRSASCGRGSARSPPTNPYAWSRDAQDRRGDPHADREQPDGRLPVHRST